MEPNFLALLVHLPTFVPVPVEADPENFPIMSLARQKRDFGITAAIVTAIAVSAASAVTAGIAMANQVNTADIINQIEEKTSEALLTLQRVDSHIASGLMLR
jgi:Na+/proline symporter